MEMDDLCFIEIEFKFYGCAVQNRGFGQQIFNETHQPKSENGWDPILKSLILTEIWVAKVGFSVPVFFFFKLDKKYIFSDSQYKRRKFIKYDKTKKSKQIKKQKKLLIKKRSKSISP